MRTNDKLTISNYLTEVYQDWQASRDEFPNNTIQASVWPVPFFGNPATAIVATVGVNPSSQEFDPPSRWAGVKTRGEWKRRLKSYFDDPIPAHTWFDPWRIGLTLLDVAYDTGTAAHFDISYRPTKAMLKNPRTDRIEFRRMVERDAAWFFKLLLLCPKLKLLLTFGPIPNTEGRPEGLFGFLFAAAPAHGFRVIQDKAGWKLWHELTGKVFLVHDADTPSEKCLTCRVVKNLSTNRDAIRSRIAPE